MFMSNEEKEKGEENLGRGCRKMDDTGLQDCNGILNGKEDEKTREKEEKKITCGISQADSGVDLQYDVFMRQSPSG